MQLNRHELFFIIFGTDPANLRIIRVIEYTVILEWSEPSSPDRIRRVSDIIRDIQDLEFTLNIRIIVFMVWKK
ncbi:hypothetical protein [Paenibacillus xylanilyticus]|uniref:hypothetical protein n=1 Tax=Paenibacillus xylanilyticus TaxID=248903 RepID=UPI0039A128CF